MAWVPLAESNTIRRTPPGPLRLRRLALGLTQADVAELAGVSREQVIRLEAGACDPRLSTASALAGALCVDLADVFPVREKRPVGEPGASTTLAEAPAADASEG